MIKFENGKVSGWETAIRGMRNPMNSWDKSDTSYELEEDPAPINPNDWFVVKLGDNDLNLMRSLANAGPDHSKFARWIDVTVDITAPLYWWKEFETYRAGVKRGDTDGDIMEIEMNSCSTMHKIHEKEFALDDFSVEDIFNESIDISIESPYFTLLNTDDEFSDFYYNQDLYISGLQFLDCFKNTIEVLNNARFMFIKTKDKRYWSQMIKMLPCNYNQRRTLKLNYQVLHNMYKARKNHKLDEWRKFCDWVETLPYFKEIYLDSKKEKDIRAKWITQVGGGGFNEWVELKCSNCRGVLRQDEDFKKYQYCPFCGAKMEG